MERNKTVAVIGAGVLGAAMASRLGETGHEVRLWNRTAERARTAAEGEHGVTSSTSLTSPWREPQPSSPCFVMAMLSLR